MLAVERRRLIAESIRARGVVSVAEMAHTLGTTEITLRRDLRSMAKAGLLVRTHGGAVLPAALGHEPSYSEKARQAVIVDPGDEVDQLLDIVQTRRLSVTHILLTHAHVDHVRGSGSFGGSSQSYRSVHRCPGMTWKATSTGVPSAVQAT